MVPAIGGRPGWMALGIVTVALSTAPAYAQQPAPPAQPAQPAQGQQPAQPAQQGQATPTTRTFPGDAGMILNFIKPDKTADFEMVMTKLKEALSKSDKPERKQQAMSWKVFKSPEAAAGGNVLYVFIIDPAVKGADYSVANIIAEAFPADQVNEIYKAYAGAYAQGQNIVNLQLVTDLSK
jgi:hypothetical protein